MSRQAFGALLGFAGAQVATVLMFLLMSEPCACLAGFCSGAECLFGKTLPQYWASYGTGASLVFSLTGWVIASD